MAPVATVMDHVTLDALSCPHGSLQLAGSWWAPRSTQHTGYLELDGFVLRGFPVRPISAGIPLPTGPRF